MASNEEGEQCLMTESENFKEPLPKPVDPEAAEEAKLKVKYPNIRPAAGGSALLQKRLQKGQKYFDSGDYQMAKQRGPGALGPLRGPSGARTAVTGDAIPTPESVAVRHLTSVSTRNTTH